MQRLFFYFISLFIIFYACSEQGKEQVDAVSNTKVNNKTTSSGEEKARGALLEQAPAEDLVYPEAFKNFGIPMFEDAKITNNLILNNSKGKFGQRLMLDCPGSVDEVLSYYDKALQKNGWERDPTKDKERSEDNFEYRSVRYLKEGHLLLISLMDVKKGTVAVNQILKEM